MEYYYTTKQAYEVKRFCKRLIVTGLIILAVLISYAASAAAGCNISVAVTSSVNVSCYEGSDGSAVASVSGATGPVSYSWSSSPVQTTATAIGLQAGTYTVTVTDSIGCTASATVIIGQPATGLSVNITGTGPTCAGNDGSAAAVAAGGTGPYSYSWTTSPVQGSATATGLEAGTYTVTVIDANNCIATATVTLDPAAVNGTISGPTSICQDPNYPQEITLIASGGTSYAWSTGSTANGTLVTPMTTTTYTVIISNGSCTDTVTHTIVVNLIPQAWISGSASVCPGDPVTLTANGGSSSATYLWSTGETTQSVTVNPLVTTTYSVTVSNGTCDDAVSFTVSVSAPPSLAINGCVQPCAFTREMVYKIPEVAGASSYTWSVPEGWSITSGQGTNTIIVSVGSASSDGMITVSTTGIGCATYNVEMKTDVVECSEDLFIPTAFTPNNDGYNDTWEIRNIESYPNKVSVFNRWGNEVFSMENYNSSWDGSGLQEGTYFFMVKIEASNDENGCSLGTTTEVFYKGYVTIVR
jgi:gliding motility-associated-like protein